MPTTEMIHANQASASAASDLASVHQAETSIREHLQRGDLESVPALCQNLYADALGCYCMAILGDVDTVARATHDTWERLLASIDVTNEQRTVRSVVLGLARKRCAYLLESQPTAAAASKASEPRTDNVRNAGSPSLAVAARESLSSLRPTERELLVLRYVSNLTYDEIAQIYTVSSDDAKLRVSRAVARLLSLSKGNA